MNMHTSRLCVSVVTPLAARLHSRRVLATSHQILTNNSRTIRKHGPLSLPVSSQFYSTDAIPPAAFEGQDKEYPQKIRKLVEDISELTLIEVADLNELLKKTLNISDTPMMAMGAMPAAAQVEDEEEAEPKQEKSSFTVKLVGFEDTKKVAVIKAIKTLIPGMNLVQAKKFVEGAPQIVRADIVKLEAEELQKAIEEVGGKTELE